jgi:hypothetical protein
MELLAIHGIFLVIQRLASFVHTEQERIAIVRFLMEPIFVIVPILTIGMEQHAVIKNF